jgi:hypothetical protein
MPAPVIPLSTVRARREAQLAFAAACELPTGLDVFELTQQLAADIRQRNAFERALRANVPANDCDAEVAS